MRCCLKNGRSVPLGKKRYKETDVSKPMTDALGIADLLALKTSTDSHFFAVHERYFSDDKLTCPACGSTKTRCSKVIKRTFKDIPQAIIAFLESTDFEDAIRNAISLGGDSDTLATITGSIAEAAYEIPDWIKDKAYSYLDEPLKDVFRRWKKYISRD